MIPKGIPLSDERLFRLAMTQRPAAKDPIMDSYERLEFFGDSVLGLIIAEYLYERHPNWDQGMLSKAKSSVVQEGPLAEAALRLGLDKHIILSPAEEAIGARKRPSILADVFEAVLGAVYIERGMEETRWFVLEQLDPYLRMIAGGDVSPNDYKSKLQEIIQSLYKHTPTYRLIEEKSSGHSKQFVAEVIVRDEVMGIGKGASKKEAEQMAAKSALEYLENKKLTQKLLEEFQ
jgi:ribonuclease-3